jgi:hypothetical protein
VLVTLYSDSVLTWQHLHFACSCSCCILCVQNIVGLVDSMKKHHIFYLLLESCASYFYIFVCTVPLCKGLQCVHFILVHLFAVVLSDFCIRGTGNRIVQLSRRQQCRVLYRGGVVLSDGLCLFFL